MKDIYEKMGQLGFSEYETKAYVGLLQKHPASGYEVSKQSGVPRAKIYETLEKLIEKKAITAILGEPVKYVPLEPAELFDRQILQLNNAVDFLNQKFKELATLEECCSFMWNLKGRESILIKAKEMIETAEKNLFCALWDQEMAELKVSLAAAEERGVKVRVAACGEGGNLLFNRFKSVVDLGCCQLPDRFIGLVKDEGEVLVASVDVLGKGVWTTNLALATITREYIRHELVLSRILGDFSAELVVKYGEDLQELLEE
ncbi:MAG: hypothetical protein M0021_06800 [Clostridia bacterium]|nr:hypothetical protein [Clostridia bacterium]